MIEIPTKGCYMSEVNQGNASVETQKSNDSVEVSRIQKKYRLRTLAETERRCIIKTLKHCNGNKTHAAKSLGISQKTLYNKIADYDLREQFVKEKAKKEVSA
jgi:DNA-binding NtrC family response regulator